MWRRSSQTGGRRRWSCSRTRARWATWAPASGRRRRRRRRRAHHRGQRPLASRRAARGRRPALRPARGGDRVPAGDLRPAPGRDRPRGGGAATEPSCRRGRSSPSAPSATGSATACWRAPTRASGSRCARASPASTWPPRWPRCFFRDRFEPCRTVLRIMVQDGERSERIYGEGSDWSSPARSSALAALALLRARARSRPRRRRPRRQAARRPSPSTTSSSARRRCTSPRGRRSSSPTRRSVKHTATRRGSFDTGKIKPGHSVAMRFSAAGTYGYLCTIHPEMHGKIIVG